MGHTDSLLPDDVLAAGAPHSEGVTEGGPDTSSEHSTGKDSGVGDSSQRSTEDLRQVAGHSVAGVVVAAGGDNHSTAAAALQGGGGPHSTSSSLLLYPDATAPNLPAMYRGNL